MNKCLRFSRNALNINTCVSKSSKLIRLDVKCNSSDYDTYSTMCLNSLWNRSQSKFKADYLHPLTAFYFTHFHGVENIKNLSDDISGLNINPCQKRSKFYSSHYPFIMQSMCRYEIEGMLKNSSISAHTREFRTTAENKDIYAIQDEVDFEKKVMSSSLPVVINFHADWCEPCHELKPLLQNLAEKHQGRMHLAEVLVDDHVQLLHTFEVTAVPAVLCVVNGQVTEKFVGLISEPELRAFINTIIGD